VIPARFEGSRAGNYDVAPRREPCRNNMTDKGTAAFAFGVVVGVAIGLAVAFAIGLILPIGHWLWTAWVWLWT
jgi:hypothetical protein